MRSANQWASEIPWASGASSGEFHGKHRCASLKWDGRCNTDIQVNFVNVRGCIERIDKVALLETSSDNNNVNGEKKKNRKKNLYLVSPQITNWRVTKYSKLTNAQLTLLWVTFKLNFALILIPSRQIWKSSDISGERKDGGQLVIFTPHGAKLWDKQFHSTYTIRYSIIGTLTCNKKTL